MKGILTKASWHERTKQLLRELETLADDIMQNPPTVAWCVAGGCVAALVNTAHMLYTLGYPGDDGTPIEPSARISDFETAAQLWQILDDIDTLDDAVKFDDKAFRNGARQFLRKRHALLESDGYKLYRPGAMPEDAAKPVEPGGKHG